MTREEREQTAREPENEFAALRAILFEDEHAKLEELEELTRDPQVPASSVSRVLPEAIAMRPPEDRALSRALTPTIEEAIQVSVKRNPKALADAIFPIIGPAIRKSMATMINGMLQRFNSALEDSLTVRGLKWRLEAKRTGRSFAEVVLLKSLVFRIEQVFLIHRESGLLLQHVVGQSVEAHDADMVSAMLSAIKDFVQDSFDTGDQAGLQILRVGDLTIAVEQGPHALLAAIVRGTPQTALIRSTLQEALENIHGDQSRALRDFQGDARPFDVSRIQLEDCLLEERKQGFEESSDKSSIPRPILVCGLLLIAFVGFLAVRRYGNIRRYERLLAAVQQEPGLEVIDSVREGGKFTLRGLRDPLSRDPAEVLEELAIDPDRVSWDWSGFASFEAPQVLARAHERLKPPSSVTMGYSAGRLTLVGEAELAWIRRVLPIAQALPGVRELDVDRLADPRVMELSDLTERLSALRVPVVPEDASGASQPWQEALALIAELDQAAAASDLVVMLRVTSSGDGGDERARFVKGRVQGLSLRALHTSTSWDQGGEASREVGFQVDFFDAVKLPSGNR